MLDTAQQDPTGRGLGFALRQLSKIHLQMKEYDKADLDVDQAVALMHQYRDVQTAAELRTIARIFQTEQRYQSVSKLYQSIIYNRKEIPNYNSTYLMRDRYALAQAQISAGQDQAVVQTLTDFMKYAVSNLPAEYSNLGGDLNATFNHIIEAKKYTNALAFANSVSRSTITQNNPTGEVDFLSIIASASETAGEMDQAESMYKRIIERFKDDPKQLNRSRLLYVLPRYASILKVKGRTADADKVYHDYETLRHPPQHINTDVFTSLRSTLTLLAPMRNRSIQWAVLDYARTEQSRRDDALLTNSFDDCCVSGGYWWWTTTPQYSMDQVKQAIKGHDLKKFDKYVDVDALVRPDG